MSETASSMPLIRSWLVTLSPCILRGSSSGLGLTHRTKCDPSHACSVCISAPRERVNAAPTDAKLLFLGWPPPVAAFPPAAPSGVQMLATWSGLGSGLGLGSGSGLGSRLGVGLERGLRVQAADHGDLRGEQQCLHMRVEGVVVLLEELVGKVDHVAREVAHLYT